MQAALNFATARADGTVPFLLNTHWTGTNPRKVMVEMHDARSIPSGASLNREGFTLSRIDCNVDYGNLDDVAGPWYDAVRTHVQKVTGASFVTLFGGPLLRFSNRDTHSKDSTVAAPARAVHADLAGAFDWNDIPGSPAADRAVREIQEKFGGRKFEDIEPKSWKIFNIWQMISSPPQDTPLAVCALDSVLPEDVLNGIGRFCPEDGPEPALPQSSEEADAPITFYRENASQRWYYVSNMQPGEAIIFRTLDPSDKGPLKGRVPHCAFDIEPMPANAVGRNSIEIRAITVFD
ncbi:MAG: CmcJ/NvfI family oxidoreductase [Sphingomonadaceae bacterium]